MLMLIHVSIVLIGASFESYISVISFARSAVANRSPDIYYEVYAFIYLCFVSMKLLHILFFLTGVQLLINGAFFSSSLLSAIGACLICLFIVTAKRKSHHQTNENL